MSLPKPVVTNKLRIVDSDNKDRITFEVEGEGTGNPVIKMRDKAGKERLTLFLDEEDGDSDARVELRDTKGDVRVALVVGSNFYQLQVKTSRNTYKNILEED